MSFYCENAQNVFFITVFHIYYRTGVEVNRLLKTGKSSSVEVQLEYEIMINQASGAPRHLYTKVCIGAHGKTTKVY